MTTEKIQSIVDEIRKRTEDRRMTYSDGGKGSGNYGHAGRPGKRGGSAKGGGAANREMRGKIWISKKKAGDDKLIERTAKKVAATKEKLKEINVANRNTWEKCEAAYQSGNAIPSGSEAAKDNKLTNVSEKAKEIYSKAFKNEKPITKDLIEIASKSGTWMYGLDYSLKTAKSVADKIARTKKKAEADGKPLSDEDVLGKMGDLVRYTQLCDHDKIGTTAKATLRELRDKGYEIVGVDNKWIDPESKAYRGFHIAAKNPDGQIFELQIHSPESMEVKEMNHVQYAVSRKVGASAYLRDTMDADMESRTATLRMPKGMNDPTLTLRGGMDPIKVYHDKGQSELANQLGECTVEELKGIIKEHRLDPARKSTRWKDKEKLADLVLRKSKERATKGNVFLNYKG